MKRLVPVLLGLPLLLNGPACNKEKEVGNNSDRGVQTTVETEQSKKKGDGNVKVKVRTPAGDFNADVKY